MSDEQEADELVFLKLGGSLITDKAREATPRSDAIRRVAREIASALASLMAILPEEELAELLFILPNMSSRTAISSSRALLLRYLFSLLSLLMCLASMACALEAEPD